MRDRARWPTTLLGLALAMLLAGSMASTTGSAQRSGVTDGDVAITSET